MDPEACYDRLITALNDGDTEEAQDAYGDLRTWIGRGGFLPSPLLDSETRRLFDMSFEMFSHHVLVEGITL